MAKVIWYKIDEDISVIDNLKKNTNINIIVYDV